MENEYLEDYTRVVENDRAKGKDMNVLALKEMKKA